MQLFFYIIPKCFQMFPIILYCSKIKKIEFQIKSNRILEIITSFSMT